MKYITAIKEKLKGYKTYAACIALAVYAVAGFIVGKVDGVTAGELVIEALAIAGLRAGVSKKK